MRPMREPPMQEAMAADAGRFAIKPLKSMRAERVGQVSVSTQALDEMARALHDSLTRFQVDQQAA